jgi:protein-S-isoprenylcysteine O-methyltransferase Ste14
MAIHLRRADETSTQSALGRLQQRSTAFRQTKLYDRMAAMPFIAWYGFCLAYRLPALVEQIGETDLAAADAAFLASLAAKAATAFFFVLLAVLLAVRNAPRARSRGLYPRVAAFGGTYLGVAMVLLPPRELPAAVSMLATLLALCGTVLAVYAAWSLGRSLSMLPEARRMVTRGAYGLVRHPLYLSEAIALFGATLQCFSPLALALLAVQCLFQLERIKNEEQVLSRAFPKYRRYMATTARLVPGVY